MTRKRRRMVPRRKFSLWVPVEVLNRLAAEARQRTKAEGRRVSVSELVVGAASRAYRRKRKVK